MRPSLDLQSTGTHQAISDLILAEPTQNLELTLKPPPAPKEQLVTGEKSIMRTLGLPGGYFAISKYIPEPTSIVANLFFHGVSTSFDGAPAATQAKVREHLLARWISEVGASVRYHEETEGSSITWTTMDDTDRQTVTEADWENLAEQLVGLGISFDTVRRVIDCIFGGGIPGIP